MKKTTTQWLSLVATLFLIAIPSIVGLFLVLDQPSIPYFYMWIIALGILVFTFSWTWLAVKFDFIALEAFNFNIPLAFVLASLFVTINLPWWGMLLIVIVMVFLALPTNMMTTKYRERKTKKLREKHMLNLQKRKG